MHHRYSKSSADKTLGWCGGRQLLSCLAALVILVSASVSQGQVRTVALSGDPAPGAGGGAQFVVFGPPVMNDFGEVLCIAVLEQDVGGVTADNDIGYWSDVTGTLDLVAREGDPAPDIPGDVPFGSTFDPVGSITNSGHVFLGNQLPRDGVDITAANSYGFWKGQNGALNLLHRQGDPPPSGPAGTQTTGLFPLINNSGDLVAVSSLVDGVGGVTAENDRIIWDHQGGVASIVARSGDTPPGMPGAVYEFLSAPIINDLGNIAFAADLVAGMGGVTEDDNRAIWSDRGGTLEIVYRKGDEAPGVPGSQFDLLATPQINDLGHLTFKAELEEGVGGVTADNKVGLWAEDELGFQLVARQGDPAPGLTDVYFDDINSSWIALQSNDSDTVAFVATLDAPGMDEDGASIWTAGTGPLDLVMRKGDPAPGAGEDVVFNTVQTGLDLRLNERGQTAFGATVEGPGVDMGTFGIWAQDIHGDLQLIAMQGKMLEIAPGDVREVSSLFFGEFNDRGELAFSAFFADGSTGLFVSRVVVPEPAAVGMMALGGLLLLIRRRRRANHCPGTG